MFFCKMLRKWLALNYVARINEAIDAEDAIKEAALIEAYLFDRIAVEIEPLPPRTDASMPPRKPDEFRCHCHINSSDNGHSQKGTA